MKTPFDRRRFLALSAGLSAAALARPSLAQRDTQPQEGPPGDDPRPGPVAIASANGLATVRLARRLMADGADPAVAAVDGVAIVEADPSDRTVGLGGLPNEDGVVQLDAAVMHGPTHKAGGVAALERTIHAAGVALKVLQTTDHVLLVGSGATRFARLNGFPEAELLTDAARESWLNWKRGLSTGDDWLGQDQMDWNTAGTEPVERTDGTIHCSCVTAGGDLGCCTTTSGLSYKIPGRVGDSPLVGCGLFCDNETGSAGCTGRGESAIQNLAAFSAVERMAGGLTPTEACLDVLQRVAQRSVKQRRLRTEDGRPNFGLKIYAVRKDGAYGCAAMYRGARFAVADAQGARLENAAFRYEGR